MKDIDENGVDRMERFRGYSQRFTQFSVADEVYRETLEYMKHLRQQRDEAQRDACAFEAINRWNIAHPKGIILECAVVRISREIAVERGWDCFKEWGGA